MSKTAKDSVQSLCFTTRYIYLCLQMPLAIISIGILSVNVDGQILVREKGIQT